MHFTQGTVPVMCVICHAGLPLPRLWCHCHSRWMPRLLETCFVKPVRGTARGNPFLRRTQKEFPFQSMPLLCCKLFIACRCVWLCYEWLSTSFMPFLYSHAMPTSGSVLLYPAPSYPAPYTSPTSPCRMQHLKHRFTIATPPAGNLYSILDVSRVSLHSSHHHKHTCVLC